MIQCVRSPNAKPECEGIYRLDFSTRGNDMPVWRHEENDRILFSGKSGKWYIADRKAEKSRFQSGEFFLAAAKPHDGLMPHEMTCVWRSGHDGTCKMDPDIKVTATVEQEGPRIPRSLATPIKRPSMLARSGTQATIQREPSRAPGSPTARDRSSSPGGDATPTNSMKTRRDASRSRRDAKGRRKRTLVGLTLASSLRALVLDFDATVTVVQEIPKETREDLLRDTRLVDAQKFRKDVFGGEDRLRALSNMLMAVCSNGVTPLICSASEAAMITKALAVAGLAHYFPYRVFGCREVRSTGDAVQRTSASCKSVFLGKCAEVERWRAGQVLFVDDQESNFVGAAPLCRTMSPQGVGLTIEEIECIADVLS